uniref:PGG domain-containing protein n=1 Tax=Chenopodium quinoa TaxID=63459 RepID=A0A803LB61_CHEQI
MADWSKLPHDILGLIALELESIEDCVYFSAVCHSWNCALAMVKLQWCRANKPTTPWLLLGHVEALDYFLSEIQFSDLVNKKDNGNDTPLHLLVKSLEEKHPVSLSSLQRLRSLIPKLSKLQVMSYNGEHKTPGDIASSIKLTESGSAIRKNYVMNDLGNAAGSHMVVAALISFTAGLTVPGGFYPEIKKEDEKEGFYPGIAMLNHSKAFQAFLFTVSSLTAILCYFLFVVVPVGKRYRQYLFTWGFRATCISIFMLMAAFLSGAYSYFKPSQKIVVVILVLVVPVVAFIFVTFVLSKIVVSIPGNQPRWQNNRLKWQLLHGHVTDTPTILNAASTLPV